MNQSGLCFICERSYSQVHIFNGKCLCESCIEITYELITDKNIKPMSTLDEKMFSLIFTLENEMLSTRNTLNRMDRLSSMQYVLNAQIRIINNLPRHIPNVNPELMRRYVSLINSYKTMLTLFLI